MHLDERLISDIKLLFMEKPLKIILWLIALSMAFVPILAVLYLIYTLYILR